MFFSKFEERIIFYFTKCGNFSTQVNQSLILNSETQIVCAHMLVKLNQNVFTINVFFVFRNCLPVVEVNPFWSLTRWQLIMGPYSAVECSPRRRCNTRQTASPKSPSTFHVSWYTQIWSFKMLSVKEVKIIIICSSLMQWPIDGRFNKKGSIIVI